jgi:hypothetical protein
MVALEGTLRSVAGLLLLAFAQVSAAPDSATPIRADLDGWQSWEVEAGSTGRRACCYSRYKDSWKSTGCHLDGEHLSGISSDCVEESDRVRIYVRLQSGKLEDLRALSAACAVEANGEIRNLGAVEASRSIARLQTVLKDNAGVRSKAIQAIAMHSNQAALAALTDMLEDKAQHKKVREEALFWIAQQESDQAFDYLDRLLSRR